MNPSAPNLNNRLTPPGYFSDHAGLQNMYVAPAAAGGTVLNDGKDWRTPKLYINDAVNAMPLGGTIHIMDGAYCGGTVPGQGIWLYSIVNSDFPMPPGFIDITNSPYSFMGYPGNQTVLQQSWPVARIFPGKPTDVSAPPDRRNVGFWLVRNSSPVSLYGIGFGPEFCVGIRLAADPAVDRIPVVTNTDHVVASTHTWTFANANFTVDRGRQITIAGASNPANNGTFTILTVVSPTVIITDGSQVDETFTSSVVLTTIIDPDNAISRGTDMTVNSILIQNCAIQHGSTTSRAISVTNTDHVVASTHTWTFANGAFTKADINKPITIVGAANPANNKTFVIASVTNATTIVTAYNNTWGVDDDILVNETLTTSVVAALRHDTGPGIDLGYVIWTHIEDTAIIINRDHPLNNDRRSCILANSSYGCQLFVKDCRGGNGGIIYRNGPSIWHFLVDSWEVESGDNQPMPPLFHGIDLGSAGNGYLKGLIGNDDGPGSGPRILLEGTADLVPSQIIVMDSGNGVRGPCTLYGGSSGTSAQVENDGFTLPGLGQFGVANGQLFADQDFGKFNSPLIANRHYNLLPYHDGGDGISGNVLAQPQGSVNSIYTSSYGANTGAGTWVNSPILDRRGGNTAFRIAGTAGDTVENTVLFSGRPTLAVGDAFVFNYWIRYPNTIPNFPAMQFVIQQFGAGTATYENRNVNGNAISGGGRVVLKTSGNREWQHYSGFVRIASLTGSAVFTIQLIVYGSFNHPVEFDDVALIWMPAATFDLNEIGAQTQNMDAFVQIPAGAGVTSRPHEKILAQGGLGVGNSAAGSALGTVVKKAQIFDGNGNSLGFVPIYDAIT